MKVSDKSHIYTVYVLGTGKWRLIYMAGAYWSFGNRDETVLLTVKLKNDESNILPKMTGKCEENMLTCGEREIQSRR